MWYFFVDAAGVLISVAWVVGTVAYWAGRRSRVGPGMPTVGVVDVLLINSTSHPVLMLLAGLWAVILLLAILMHSLAVVFDGVLISLMIAVGALVVRTTRKLLR